MPEPQEGDISSENKVESPKKLPKLDVISLLNQSRREINTVKDELETKQRIKEKTERHDTEYTTIKDLGDEVGSMKEEVARIQTELNEYDEMQELLDYRTEVKKAIVELENELVEIPDDAKEQLTTTEENLDKFREADKAVGKQIEELTALTQEWHQKNEALVTLQDKQKELEVNLGYKTQDGSAAEQDPELMAHLEEQAEEDMQKEIDETRKTKYAEKPEQDKADSGPRPEDDVASTIEEPEDGETMTTEEKEKAQKDYNDIKNLLVGELDRHMIGRLKEIEKSKYEFVDKKGDVRKQLEVAKGKYTNEVSGEYDKYPLVSTDKKQGWHQDYISPILKKYDELLGKLDKKAFLSEQERKAIDTSLNTISRQLEDEVEGVSTFARRKKADAEKQFLAYLRRSVWREGDFVKIGNLIKAADQFNKESQYYSGENVDVKLLTNDKVKEQSSEYVTRLESLNQHIPDEELKASLSPERMRKDVQEALIQSLAETAKGRDEAKARVIEKMVSEI